MKPHTRRIWIFIGLKAKEIGIVLVWIVGSSAVLYVVFILNRYVLKMDVTGSILFIAVEILILTMLGALTVGFFEDIYPATKKWIKKWIADNWRKADQIEKRTRKGK